MLASPTALIRPDFFVFGGVAAIGVTIGGVFAVGAAGAEDVGFVAFVVLDFIGAAGEESDTRDANYECKY